MMMTLFNKFMAVLKKKVTPETGDLVKCSIRGMEVEGIYKKSGTNLRDIIFSDSIYASGGASDEAKGYGYEFGWYVDHNVKKLKVTGHKVLKELPKPVPKYVSGGATIDIGCDPEFFFMNKDGVVGAEKILPKNGIISSGKIIIDGVQAELNPTATYCREILANNIANCFHSLHTEIHDKNVSISFDPLVPISKSNLDALSDKAKHFGCTPSHNAYNDDQAMTITDSSKYYFRPAGGHIHLGNRGEQRTAESLSNYKKIVPLLDILVGNTCVLVDRHEGNVERRKVYGRAGEYRTPSYGVEYRTLSNFWLRSYPLMSMVFGLARMAVHVMNSSTKERDFAQEIIDCVNREDIIKAINNNDFELALKNFSKVRKVLSNIIPVGSQSLDRESIPKFLYFVGKIKENGLEYWFKQEPFEYWRGVATGDHSRGRGFESFLAINVVNDMEQK